jgi:hypothetical protein
MRTIAYAGLSFDTTDAVADAVLEYAKALAVTDSSDVVRIPVILDEAATEADIIIGPASEITAVKIDGELMMLDDAATVEDLRWRAALLTNPPPAQPIRDDPDDAVDDFHLGLD